MNIHSHIGKILGAWLLLYGVSAPASLMDPATPPAPASGVSVRGLPARLSPAPVSPDGPRLEETGETDFSIPVDEIHAAEGPAGSRLITGTQDGEMTAFRIQRAGAIYEVVELSKSEVAWQLSKIVFSWTAVACLLFAGLFSIAERSKRHRPGPARVAEKLNGIR